MIAALASLGAGCETIFNVKGGHDPKDAVIDAPPDVPANVVAGSYTELYATNNPDLTPTTTSYVFAPSEITLTVTLDDGSTPPVDYNADGTFTFGLAQPGQSYRLVITNSAIGVLEYQAADPRFTMVSRLAGRPDRVPVTMPTTINFGYSNPAACTVAAPCYPLILSTGLYSFSGVSGVSNSGSFAYNWQNASSQAGTLGLLDATRNDAVYLEQYQQTMVGTGYYNMTVGVATAQITQTDGGTSSIGNGNTRTPMTAVSLNKCAHMIAAFYDELHRLGTAVPETGYNNAADDWQLAEVPDETIGPVAASWVGVYSQPSGSVADSDGQFGFGNPFDGTQLIAGMQVYASRPISLPGTTTPGAFTNQTFEWIDMPKLDSTCPANVVTLPSGGIAIASLATLAGVALDTDSQTVMLDPDTDPVVTWTTAAPGPLDYSIALLYELLPSGGTTTQVLRYQIMIHDRTRVSFPRALFATGHAYVVRIDNHVGIPNAKSGDFSVLTYPVVNTTTWSHWFYASTTGT